MVSEPVTGRCGSEDARDGLRDPTVVGEENETFLIRVWKLSLMNAFYNRCGISQSTPIS